MPGDFLPPLVGILRLNNAQFMAATRESGAAMRKTQAEGKGAYATLGAGAEKALKGIAIASGVAAVASIKLATEFDSAMERVHTQAGASQAEVEKMSGAMLDLAPKVGTGPEALAESLFHVESVGLRGAKALDTVAASAKLAKVGNADLEQTTNAVAAAFVTQMKDAKSLNQIVGLLNATIGQGNMKMNDLTAAISTGILPVAKNFGLGLADVGGALAVMTDRGMRADEAATRLKMTLTMMEAPTNKAVTALNSIGLSSTSLALDLHKPEGLVTAFRDLKSHMDAAGLSAVQQARVIADVFGGGRSSAGVQTLMNNLDTLDEKTKGVTKGVKDFGEAWKQTQKTASFQFDSLKASMESAAVRLGNVLLPSVLRIAGAVGRLADAFAKLPSGIQGTIVTVGLLAYPVLKVTKAILAGRDAWIAWRAAAAGAAATEAGLATLTTTATGEAAATGAMARATGSFAGQGMAAIPIVGALIGLAGRMRWEEEQNISTFDDLRHALGFSVKALDKQAAGEAAAATAAKADAQAQQEQVQAFQEVSDKVAGAIPLLEGYKNNSKLTANTILGNLRQERDGYRTWSTDVQTLLRRGVDPGVIKELSDKGPGYIHAMVHASDKQLAQLQTIFDQRSTAAGKVMDQILKLSGTRAGQDAAANVEAGFGHPKLVANVLTVYTSTGTGGVSRRMAAGGVLHEPVVGVGTRTGTRYTLGEAGPEAVVPLGGHGGARGVGGGAMSVGPVNIYVSGATDPHRTALVVREELLKLGRRNPSVLSGLGVKA